MQFQCILLSMSGRKFIISSCQSEPKRSCRVLIWSDDNYCVKLIGNRAVSGQAANVAVVSNVLVLE